MSIPIDELLTDFSVDVPTNDQTIIESEKSLGIKFPSDYSEFLLRYNGGEGFFGTHYLVLWKVEELKEFNSGYQVHIYAPGLIIFGSTGGGEGFAFDTRTSPYKIVQVPFIGMDLKYANVVSDSFIGLLERMAQTDGSLF